MLIAKVHAVEPLWTTRVRSAVATGLLVPRNSVLMVPLIVTVFATAVRSKMLAAYAVALQRTVPPPSAHPRLTARASVVDLRKKTHVESVVVSMHPARTFAQTALWIATVNVMVPPWRTLAMSAVGTDHRATVLVVPLDVTENATVERTSMSVAYATALVHRALQTSALMAPSTVMANATGHSSWMNVMSAAVMVPLAARVMWIAKMSAAEALQLIRATCVAVTEQRVPSTFARMGQLIAPENAMDHTSWTLAMFAVDLGPVVLRASATTALLTAQESVTELRKLTLVMCVMETVQVAQPKLTALTEPSVVTANATAMLFLMNAMSAVETRRLAARAMWTVKVPVVVLQPLTLAMCVVASAPAVPRTSALMAQLTALALATALVCTTTVASAMATAVPVLSALVASLTAKVSVTDLLKKTNAVFAEDTAKLALSSA